MATEKTPKDLSDSTNGPLIFDSFNWSKPDPESMKLELDYFPTCHPPSQNFQFNLPNKNEES